jgi:hypothetical protein
MFFKVSAGILAVFGLRMLVRRFRDPDTDWN